MKPFIFAALMAATSIIALPAAHADSKPTPEQLHEACTGYAGFGEMVATYRQNDIPKQDVITSFDEIENLPADEKKAMIQMAEAAYTAEIQPDETSKAESVAYFRKAIYDSCYAELSSR